MADDSPAAADGASQATSWREALAELERSLQAASQAAARLRRSLEAADCETRPGGAALQDIGALAGPTERPEERDAPSPFERLWERIEHERLESRRESPPAPAAERRGLDLLPRQYLVTVEDQERKVDLAPLHRAFLSLARMEDFSLISFAHGVPVISLRVEGELDLDRLGQAVSTTMDQDCEVVPQDAGRLVVRLTSQQERGG